MVQNFLQQQFIVENIHSSRTKVAMTIPKPIPSKGRVTLEQATRVKSSNPHRGRGATSNQTGRFESEIRETFDDGWDYLEEAPEKFKTSLTREDAKTIITRNKSPDINFDRSINMYRGCEHGCVYCYARPSHTFLGLSAGLDFESRLFYKPNAPDLLRAELEKPSYQPEPIALGSNTDCYQPIERSQQLTRQVLEVLSEYNHPVNILTKSALIQRDIDIISSLSERNLVRVGVSVTTLDSKLARLMEPRASTPKKRLETISALSNARIPVVAMYAPVIPGLNDSELETILETVAESGAESARYVILRLPLELKDIFHEWLATHFPNRSAKVINTLREMRGGQDYDSRWFERGRGHGVFAQLIAQRMAKARIRFGLDKKFESLRTDLFAKKGATRNQLAMDFSLAED